MDTGRPESCRDWLRNPGMLRVDTSKSQLSRGGLIDWWTPTSGELSNVEELKQRHERLDASLAATRARAEEFAVQQANEARLEHLGVERRQRLVRLLIERVLVTKENGHYRAPCPWNWIQAITESSSTQVIH